MRNVLQEALMSVDSVIILTGHIFVTTRDEAERLGFIEASCSFSAAERLRSFYKIKDEKH